jgi:S-adenosylmethionine hydrolase
MKAVMLSIAPSVRIVDITHAVEPQNVRQAAYLLWASYQFFPKGTIFVCVVDPGVGSARRLIGVRSRAYTFLAPDNGILDFVLWREEAIQAYELALPRVKKLPFFRSDVSATFHGRDLFAPAAAFLARGASLGSLGRPVKLGEIPSFLVSNNSTGVQPSILHIDRFGNIITNIDGRDSEFLLNEIKGIGIGKRRISRWIRTYADAPSQIPCLLIGSSGLVEIAIKNGNAASILNADFTTTIRMLNE